MSWQAPPNPVCPECGGGPICRNTTVWWDEETKQWEVSDSASDEMFCGDCGTEFRDGKMEATRRLLIRFDADPENPRKQYEHFDTLVTFHPKYVIGEKVPDELNNDSVYSMSQAETVIWQRLKAYAVLPVYLMDHSGLMLSTQPFSCPWDSGQVGFIYTTREQVQAMGLDPDAPQTRATVLSAMIGSVEEYSLYLEGRVYGYEVQRVEKGDWATEDSCWGFYGEDCLKEHLKDCTDFTEAQIDEAFNSI